MEKGKHDRREESGMAETEREIKSNWNTGIDDTAFPGEENPQTSFKLSPHLKCFLRPCIPGNIVLFENICSSSLCLQRRPHYTVNIRVSEKDLTVARHCGIIF